jgi:hypothetical protein
MGWVILTFAIAGAVVFATPRGQDMGQQLLGYLVRRPLPVYTWKILTQADIGSGALIPADTHVVFHLPPTFDRISRETLLGQKGKTTRYWGYCFPENAPRDIVDNRTGFPGLIFLSEKERAIRKEAEAREAARFSPTTQLPDAKEAEALNNPVKPSGISWKFSSPARCVTS